MMQDVVTEHLHTLQVRYWKESGFIGSALSSFAASRISARAQVIDFGRGEET